MKYCLNCGNELKNDKRTFCCKSCSAKYRMHKIDSIDYSTAPIEVYEVLSERYGKETAKTMMAEQGGEIFMTASSLGSFTKGRTYGDMYETDLFNYSENRLKHYNRAAGRLTYSMIKDMLKCGQVVFGLHVKKAPIENVFRKEGALAVDISRGSKNFRKKIANNLVYMIQRYIHDFMSMLEYGVSINEVVWRVEDGLALVDAINSVNPETVDHLNLTSDGSFDGFTQIINSKVIDVPMEQSLLLSYNKKFRNLWGESILTAVYPFYFWYDVVWRSFVRYLEKSSTPVVVATAPSNRKVIDKSGRALDALVIAEQLADKAAKSPAIALPSDRDQDGNPMWSLSYLKNDYSGNQFESALKLLGVMITRSLLVTDTVATQLDSGSFNMSSIHYQILMLDNSRILNEIITQLNRYLCTRYSLFNFGSEKTMMVNLRSSALDMEEQQALIDLLKVAVNSKLPVINEIDFRKIGEIGNIPFLTKEEVEQLKQSNIPVKEQPEQSEQSEQSE